jgi:peptide chain release factor 1
LPRDEDDSRGAILEIRPGTGGSEVSAFISSSQFSIVTMHKAALFAQEMFTMYQHFSESNNWDFEEIVSEAKDLSAVINGEGKLADSIALHVSRAIF